MDLWTGARGSGRCRYQAGKVQLVSKWRVFPGLPAGGSGSTDTNAIDRNWASPAVTMEQPPSDQASRWASACLEAAVGELGKMTAKSTESA